MAFAMRSRKEAVGVPKAGLSHSIQPEPVNSLSVLLFRIRVEKPLINMIKRDFREASVQVGLCERVGARVAVLVCARGVVAHGGSSPFRLSVPVLAYRSISPTNLFFSLYRYPYFCVLLDFTV